MKMIISAGGTGGHIYPALAIIKEFQEKEKDFKVLYIGTHNRMENTLIPEQNIPYEAIKIYGFDKKKIGRDIKNIYYLYKAYNKCLKIMEEFKPDIVVGVGGYVTMPVIMASRKLKIKRVIHEQNSIPGKTNLFLSGGVNAVLTSFKDSEKYFKKEVKCIYTGNPSGDNVKKLSPISKKSLGLNDKKKLVLITGGSLGSGSLMAKIKEFLKLSANKDYEILYITGQSYYDELVKNNHFAKNIKILPYLPNLAALFKNCDVIISRAGASTIAEILSAKVPAILIPSPNVANNHQYYNAKDLSDNNLALMIEEKDLTKELLEKKVDELLNNEQKRKQIITNLNNQTKVNSSEKIYKTIKEIIYETK